MFISPEFSPSLCPSTRLCGCISCVPSLNSHYSFYLLSPVSFPQRDRDRLTDLKKMEERRRRPQLILVCRSRGSFDAARGSPSPPFAGSQRPFAAHVSPLFAGSQRPFAARVSPPFAGSQRPFAAHVSPPVTASPPPEAHVPLGLLVTYEGMDWSPAPEPTPRQRPPVPAPRQRPPEPAPRQRPPVPAPRQRPPVPAPRQRPPVPAFVTGIVMIKLFIG